MPWPTWPNPCRSSRCVSFSPCSWCPARGRRRKHAGLAAGRHADLPHAAFRQLLPGRRLPGGRPRHCLARTPHDGGHQRRVGCKRLRSFPSLSLQVGAGKAGLPDRLQNAKTEMFNLAATSFAFRSSMASILPAFASPRLDQRHDGVADQRKGHDDHGGGDHVRPVMRHLCVVR